MLDNENNRQPDILQFGNVLLHIMWRNYEYLENHFVMPKKNPNIPYRKHKLYKTVRTGMKTPYEWFPPMICFHDI